ncbi:MAG: BrxA family protein, partial [Desulfovermiculus sp.]
PLGSSFWHIIEDGSLEQATQALLCAAIKHSHLLGDFIQQVVSTQIRTFQTDIAYRDWNAFFDQCRSIDPTLDSWSESTQTKVRQVVFRILAEAKVIDSSRSKHLLPFSLLPEIRLLLETHQESYVLHCLEIFK